MRIERFEWDGSDAGGARRRAARAGAARSARSATTSPRSSSEVARGRRRARCCELERALRRPSRPSALRVPSRARSQRPLERLDPELREALRARRREHPRRRRGAAGASPAMVELPQGQTVEIRDVPVAAAGVYAPGGTGRLSLHRPDVLHPGRGRGRRAGRRRLAAGRRRATSAPSSSPPRRSAASTRSTRWAAPRRSSPSPRHRDDRRGRRDRRARATAGSRRPSASSSGGSGSTAIAGPSELMVIAGDDADPRVRSRSTSAPRPSTATTARWSPRRSRAALLDRIEAEVGDARRRAPERRRRAAGAGRRCPTPRPRVDARQRARPRAPRARERGRRAARRARSRTAGCVFVGERGGDRLRRLRRRLQPRAADRRRRALLGPARPGDVPAPDRDRRRSRPMRPPELRPHVRYAGPRRGLPGARRVRDR